MKRFIAAVIAFGVITAPSFALFKKKKEKEEKFPPMVQTVEQWHEEATPPNMDSRKMTPVPIDKNNKFIPEKEKPVYLEPYNVVSGRRELDLSKLYKTRGVRSPFIASPDFKNAVYTETYYFPQRKQVASTVYLMELYGGDDKEKLKSANVFDRERFQLISTALPYLKDGFFSTLTVVDFSKDGTKILVKEKRGSNRYGIYETYAWVFFLTEDEAESNTCYINNKDFSSEVSPVYGFKDEDILSEPPSVSILEQQEEQQEETQAVQVQNMENTEEQRWYNTPDKTDKAVFAPKEKSAKGFPVRLNLLNEQIKAYWFDRKDLILNFVRWNIEPLGFNSANDNEIFVNAYAYSKEGKRVSLGQWAVNLEDGTPHRVTEGESVQVGANAFVLVDRIEPR